MKSVQTQLAEGLLALKAKSKSKLNEVLLETSGKSVEHQLGIVNAALQESGINIRKNMGADQQWFDESVHGSFIGPEQVAQTAKEFRMSIREASVYLGLPDPGKDAKFSSELQETLEEAWEPMRGLLNESEIAKLVAKGIRP